jgi:flagellar FliJ protein
VRTFTFKLETVLEQRTLIERLRQKDVAAAQQAVLRVQAELDALEAVNRSSAADLRRGGRQLSGATVVAHQRFAQAARQKAASLKRLGSEARRELEQAQAQLTEAAKQRKVMEKLREKEHARWREAAQRSELLEAEEVARRMEESDAGEAMRIRSASA